MKSSNIESIAFGGFFMYNSYVRTTSNILIMKQLHNNFIIISIIILICLSGILSGCSTYQTVMGYFNTYYNAKNLFDKCEQEVIKNTQKDQRFSVLPMYVISTSIESDLDKVIEKCSRLIQFYPQSTLVDDALLIIGKSYVYKDETESAIRKFEELFNNFHTSDMIFDARLWHAKAKYYSHRKDEAKKHFNELSKDAYDAGELEVATQAKMMEAWIYQEEGELSTAIDKYSQAVSIGGSDDLCAFALFLQGQNLEQLNMFERAKEAYLQAIDLADDEELVYQVKIRCASVLSRIGKFDDAISMLDEMSEEVINPEYRSMIELERANAYNLKGDTAIALSLYSAIDSIYRRTDAAARGAFQRGVLYEEKFKDFHTALKYYEKAGTEFPSSTITPIAKKKANILSQYFQYRRDIYFYDSLLIKALSDSAKDQSRQITRDSLEISTSQKSDSVTTLANVDDQIDSTLSIPHLFPSDTLNEVSEDHDPTKQLDDFDEEEPEDDEIARRRDRAQQLPIPTRTSRGVLIRGGRDSMRTTPSAQVRVHSGQQQLAGISPDSLRSLIAQKEFELGGLLFHDFGMLDSAIFWYEDVVKRFPSTQYVSRSLYALSEIYKIKGDTVKVDSLHKLILEQFGGSIYASQVLKQKGNQQIDTPFSDSLDVHYNELNRLLQDKKYDKAIRLIEDLMNLYPETPKLYYSLGWIYENELIYLDSATAWYQRLVDKFPNSIYANSVKPKLIVKQNPESVSQFVKIKEYQAVPKQASINRSIRDRDASGIEFGRERTSQKEGGRNKKRDIEDEEIDEEEVEEPEIDEPDEDNE